MAREITNHGQSGYRRGCKCEVCRRGHRESVAAWRARKKQAAVQKPVAPLDPLTSAPALDERRPAGPIEAALTIDLAELVGDPPWARTLSSMALYNARLLDQVSTFDRLDLVSPIQLRTMEIFDRLRAVSQPAGNSIADSARALLDDLSTP